MKNRFTQIISKFFIKPPSLPLYARIAFGGDAYQGEKYSKLFLHFDIEAVIFDMDGVLINSEDIWAKNEEGYIRQYIPDFPDGMHHEIVGRSIFGTYDFLLSVFPNEMQKFSREEFLEGYVKYGVENIYPEAKVNPGIAEVLPILSQKYPLALASSSPFAWINTAIDGHHLRKFFPVITSGEEVKHSKPDPEIFLLSSKKLGVSPEKCLVIEDSANGILSAKSAGMMVIAYKGNHNAEYDFSEADVVISDFMEVLEIIS